MRKTKVKVFNGRRYLFLFVIFAIFILLFARALQLQWLHADFYHKESSSRQIGTVDIRAHRGAIKDRHGEALAISTPVYSVTAKPPVALANPESISVVAKALALSERKLIKKIQRYKNKQFVYIKRHVLPAVASTLEQRKLKGIALVNEYRRYYPAGEMTAHVVGLTNIDDQGLEGIELAFDDWLRGVAGKKRVLRDGKRRVIADIESVREPYHGRDLTLSIDKRIQYLSYRELLRTINYHGARAGSVVVLSVTSGEVLAMVNLPSFNPNDRSKKITAIRNRAVTDVFEPGSTIKPFLIAAALESKLYHANSKINTSPGYFTIGEFRVSDPHNYGVIDLQTLLVKSSNVGAVRVALKMTEKNVWSQYRSVGFGQLTGSGFPGERAGEFVNYANWSQSQRATLAYGYGISTTALQLARAYSVIANNGVLLPMTFVINKRPAAGQRVMSARSAQRVRHMLQKVLSTQGTGKRASMQGYTAAGKTGTSRKPENGTYSRTNYIALFAGMAPADNPEIVVVALIDQPVKQVAYYGGEVAAPLFARVTEGALRLMNVPLNVIDSNKRTVLLTAAGTQ